MLDFTEQEVSVTSLPKLSADMPIVSDNRLDTDTLSDPDTAAATLAALAPWLDREEQYNEIYLQDEEEHTD